MAELTRIARARFVSAARGKVSLPFMGIQGPIELGNLGMADSLILMVLALVVFGPRRLPQIGKQIGKLMFEFRKASNDFKYQMEEELRLSEEADRRKKEEEQRKQLAVSQSAQESVSQTPALANSIESPYPGEETDPPTPSAPAPGEVAPRITPPSTGETVAARTAAAEDRPADSGDVALAEGTAKAVEPSPAQLEIETAKDENTPAAEAVSQNG
jgi:sec-independent protein translocase protein TatB